MDEFHTLTHLNKVHTNTHVHTHTHTHTFVSHLAVRRAAQVISLLFNGEIEIEIEIEMEIEIEIER